ncbi:hypothetical protein BJ878DRAFT_567806 [Calycina marina]|uniref:Zn(2)-C6 fungal-type domain-containing protein n=1 Tax=Calycina marina TaxID=1763456 RepID=A0A9P7Z3E7_9HELO|nr:hypothetical protein BJ878DRAFT_567806 [Calycina marina]
MIASLPTHTPPLKERAEEKSKENENEKETKPRRRQCGPKVRSGCKTCKIRRVKCDETHPSCNRCTSTGRRCDGYYNAAEPKTISTIQRAFAHLPGTVEEKRSFSYFIQNTVPELSGYFETGFWESLIVQASTSEPSLRHALIAIGSLHEDFVAQRQMYQTKEESLAVAQYAKAIRYLRKSLALERTTPLTALLACILFVCFDSLRGNFSAAVLHLQSGLRIIKDARICATCSSADEKIIEQTISPLFIRISLQAILYLDTRDTDERQAFSTEMMSIKNDDFLIPLCFERLEDARLAMEQTTEELFRMLYLCDGNVNWSAQSLETWALQASGARHIREWNEAFDNFMNAHGAKLDSKQLRGAVLLKIQTTTIGILARAVPNDAGDGRSVEEVANDPAAFTGRDAEFNDAEFNNVVTLSKTLISAAELDAKMGKPSLSFSTDLGVIAPLYYVCTHCQNDSFKKHALELLARCPRREGMWDSNTTAQIVREYWVFEDKHILLQEKAGEKKPLSEMLDLEVYDGMHWEWKWKDVTG